LKKDPAKPRIVIIGAGFAGAWTAKYLQRKLRDNAEIELINQVNYFVFQPLLPEVTSGTISAQDAVTPLRQMVPGVRFRMAEVLDIDFDRQRIDLLQGSKRRLISIDYQHVVIACGQSEARDLLPGLSEHALSLKDVADAHHLRNVLIDRLEHADITSDPQLKQRLLTLVVAGGGFSGIETIGEVSEMLRRILRYYPNVQAHELRGILLQRDARILPEMPPQLAEYAHRQLLRRGVEIHLNTGLRAVSKGCVELDNGDMIAAATVISTIGNAPTAMIRKLEQQQRVQLQHGKLAVDRMLRLPQKNAWAIGDVALIPLTDDAQQKSDYAPPTAQFAVREAQCLSANICATLKGEQCHPFHYQPRGALASIGHYKAVGEVFGVRVSGLLAWSIWRGFYMLMLPQFVTQVRVALNWFFDYFMPRSVVQINTRGESCARNVLYRAGETIFAAGQMVDGHYTIVEGEVELRSDNESACVLKAGAYMGSYMHHDIAMKIELVAKTDCKLLSLRNADVARLCYAIPELQKHFQQP
jgi:NADH dehydrogenase